MQSLLVVGLVALAAGAQGTVRHTDPDGTFSIELPPAWKAESKKGKTAVLAIKFRLPDWDNDCTINIYHSAYRGQTPRAAAYLDRESDWAREWDDREVSLEPLPHLILYDGGDAKTHHRVRFYRNLRGRLVWISVSVIAAAYDQYKEELLAAVRSIATTLPEFPAIPPGYEAEVHDRLVIVCKHKLLRKLAKIKKLVVSVRKDFEKLHGKIPERKLPLHLVVLEDLKKTQEYDPEAKFSLRTAKADIDALRVFASPPKEVRDHASLAYNLYGLYFAAKYGSRSPYWLSYGLRRLAWSRRRIDKPLPHLSRGYYDDVPGNLVRFDRLAAMEDEDWTAYLDHGMAYTALFRNGPAKYRKVLKAYLEALEDHGDWYRADREIILFLDQDRLHKDALRYIRNKLRRADYR